MPLIPLIPPLIIPLNPPLKSNGSPSGVNQFDSRHRPSTALATWQEGRGAGGGGFILFYVKKQNQKKFKKEMNKYIDIPFQFSTEGSKIIFNQKDG